MVHLSFTSEFNWGLIALCFFAGKTEGAECTDCWKLFVGARVRMMHQPHVCGWHHVTRNALHNMATLFKNHPYISSSGTSVGTKFTGTYVGMVVE